jgi:hypothetical protein
LLLNVVALLMMLDGRVIDLPAGETHLKRPLEVPKGAAHLTIRGNPRGSTLVMGSDFRGSAAIVLDGVSDAELSGFEIRGNRTELKSDWYLPLKEAAFADYYSDNGIVVRRSHRVRVRNVGFQKIRAFPLIFNASEGITIDTVKIEDCGTLNRAGRNNTTGGILLEEGVSRFEVVRSTISRITGNAIWTHSYSRSPRQSDGLIRGNLIDTVGRDAIQIGHASRVRVEGNTGANLGFPVEYVDVENHGVAVALDTAGNVDHSVYTKNRFTDVNGQCIDLDGFHDGSVTDNSCINFKSPETYPASHYAIVFGNNDPAVEATNIVVTGNTAQGFAYGGLFLIGTRNRVENNRLLDVNRARCGTSPLTARCNYAVAEQPDLLKSGIYLAANGGRPTTTKGNIVRGNIVTGFGIKAHCIAADHAVSLTENSISGNSCDDVPVRP